MPLIRRLPSPARCRHASRPDSTRSEPVNPRQRPTSRAVLLLGGPNNNQAIHLERLRIFGNGIPPCDGGITIAGGNPGTLIVNSLIYGNGRNGIATIDIAGGPHYLIGNTIHGNAWNGVNVTRSHEAFLVNNALPGNGTGTR